MLNFGVLVIHQYNYRRFSRNIVIVIGLFDTHINYADPPVSSDIRLIFILILQYILQRKKERLELQAAF